MELTPKLYINLTMKMLPKLIAKLAGALEEHKEEIEKAGPENAMQIIIGILLAIRQEIGKEFLPEGITDEDMERYKQEHEDEINAYLASHPQIQKKMDKLQQEFQSKFPDWQST